MSHTKKNVKQESHATPESLSFTPHVYDEQLDNITTTISELASIMYSLHSRFDSKFTSLQTQLDEIQWKLEKND